MSNPFHTSLRQRFGARVPFPPEYIDIPTEIEPVIIEFFERLAAFDSDLRVQRIWLDDSKLRIVVAGSSQGLDDIIADAEEAAADLLRDRFPLRPDDIWYAAMRGRYGDAVPDVEHLQFRRGLQTAVGDMYAQLHDLGLIDKVDIRSVVTRNAGFVVVDARIADCLPDIDRAAIEFVLEGARGDLVESCEHCGRPGEIVSKVGLEALLDDPDAALGDRLLCSGCYEKWSRHE
ncbi:hypothetical protein [Hoeflea olei]|uniref:Uncharacterized protein n=1 Tax=Hoeflea olei TaxID=1480615 RepID=A0A1C1YRX8_9HYPH|nr:hypothetical protein [Hoeflea olei]OCW56253.1 hypothetical protein AWJ14_19355 [Hoeflea olei]